MTQSKRKKVNKISPNDQNNDDLKSLRDEFENEALTNEIIDKEMPTDSNKPNSLNSTKILSLDEEKDSDSSIEQGVMDSDKANIVINGLEKSSLEKDDFANELAELRSIGFQNSDDPINTDSSKSGKSNIEKRDLKNKERRSDSNKTNPEKNKILSGDRNTSNKKLSDKAVYAKPPEIDDSHIDLTNEEFINKVTASLNEDQYLFEPTISEIKHKEDLPQDESTFKDYVEDIENEIDKAGLAKNPFEPDLTKENENDFMTKLQELFPENYHPEGITKPLADLEELGSSETSLSQESWQDVIKATEDSVGPAPSSEFLLEQRQRNDFEITENENGWDSVSTDRLSPFSDENKINEIQTNDKQYDADSTSTVDINGDESSENEESVDVLRRSFIEEFEQTPWQPEIESPSNADGWLKSKFKSFANWISSLNTAEKILLVMSSIISLAVIIAIGLVLFNWQNSQVNVSSPPEIIDSVKSDSIYPTGLQLPGGWFFYLQQGELKNNQWSPQTAEWLPNSTLRRVAAIPWSRQAEAVVQTLNTGDEIRVFMNNNDILNYYVEKVIQVERDNVEILTDTEPSLAVVLFKTDNSDRWVVIAKP